MTIPFALCAYSMPHLMGYLPTKSGERCPHPLTPDDLLNTAQELELAGVEFSLLSVVPSFDGARVEVAESKVEIAAELKAKGLRFIADYGAILDTEAEDLRVYLTQAAKAGAKVVRVTLSHVLCGDRRSFPGGWQAHLEALAKRLNAVLPHAESLGLCVAVENHQDLFSDELLWLAEQVQHSPSFGVTLDTGNPLAVGEDPVEYTRRIAPIIRHIHLKDYTLHFAQNGYHLVRCTAGEGVIDFPAILALVRANGHDVLPAIEIAAQATRTIPILEPSWWETYPADHASRLIPALQLLWEKGRPQGEPYSSAWERGEDSEAVGTEEWNCVRRSAVYFRTLPAQV